MRGFLIITVVTAALTATAHANKADCKGAAEDIARKAKEITVADVDEATGKAMEESLNSAYHYYYDALCDYATLEAAFKGTNLRALTKEEIGIKK